MNEQMDVAALLDAGMKLGTVRKNPNPHGRDFILKPTDTGSAMIEYLERPETPPRRAGTVVANDTESFIEAVNRYHDKNAVVIYGTLEPASFTGVLNDHLPGVAPGANWRDHRVTFSPDTSEEWKVWDGQNQKPMTQEEFAYFIERNLPDFKTPTGAKMLETALTFKINRKMNYKSAINLADGTLQLEYAEVSAADGKKVISDLIAAGKLVQYGKKRGTRWGLPKPKKGARAR